MTKADRMVITLRSVFLWLLFCPAVFAQCSENQGFKRTYNIIQNLCNLGEMRPVKCKTEAENMKIQSPNVPKQEESRLLVLEMSFRNVAGLLMNASTEWKASERQQLQEFLRHQTQCYTACIPAASSADAEVRNWNEFWSELDRYLSEKSFSSCAWESARTVIIRVMRRFIRLTKKTSNAIC